MQKVNAKENSVKLVKHKPKRDCERLGDGVERTLGRRKGEETKRTGDDFSVLKVTETDTIINLILIHIHFFSYNGWGPSISIFRVQPILIFSPTQLRSRIVYFYLFIGIEDRYIYN